MQPTGIRIRACATANLTDGDLAGLRALFAAAWPGGRFTEDDVRHALGGNHWIAELDGRIVSHASVVERRLDAGGHPLRTGYLEAVATLPELERRGIATRLVRRATAHIDASFELGALSTGVPAFYLRLGWQAWLGPTWVRLPSGELERTQDDDDAILVRRTSRTPPLARTEPLTCDWRSGDVW